MPSDRARKLLALAAELSAEERAEVAIAILETLPVDETGAAGATPPRGPSYDQIRRRIERVRSGEASLVPFDRAWALIHHDD